MKIYFAACGFFSCRKNVFVPHAPGDVFLEGPMPVFVILHPRGNVLFDTGPHPDVFRDAASRWGGLAKAFAPRGDEGSGILPRLKRIGLRPEAVRYVVNSHLHFDHAGGNQFFPRATFLASREEMEFARNPESQGKGYFRADWDHPLSYREVEGPVDIFGDGALTLLPLPGHTPGHQGMLVRRREGDAFLLTGDSVPLRENLLPSAIPRNHLDKERALATVLQLRQRAETERAAIIHGHDPCQWREIEKGLLTIQWVKSDSPPGEGA